MSPHESYFNPGPSLTKPRQFYHTIAFLSKLSIILAILIVLAIFGTLYPKIPFFQRRLRKSVPETRCVVYDRPPRTGSTTVSKTLGSCLSSRGYDVARNFNGLRSTVVAKMLSSERDRMAMAQSHVAMSESDLELLEEHCGELLYITGAAPMKKRLYSAMKYSLHSGNGNSTIDTDMVARAMAKAERNRLQENFLEAYPHVTEERKPLNVIPERIAPDYVIRTDSLNEDLQAILNALRCNTTITTRNVHKASTEETKVLEAIKLYDGDALYKWLMKFAKDNDKGLRKASAF